jgi:hypothetical protein
MSAAAAAAAKREEPDHRSYLLVMKNFMPHLWAGRVSSDKQLAAIHLIANETLGQSRAPKSPAKEFVPLTVAQIAKRVGCSRFLAYDFLADAHKRGLIEIHDEPAAKDRAVPTPSHAQARWYAVRPQNWAKAKKYVPKLRPVIPFREPEDEPEPDAPNPDPGPEGEPAIPLRPAAITVQPGERSAPIPVPPAAKQLVIACAANIVLGVHSFLDAGILTLTVGHEKGRRKGEPPVARAPHVPGEERAKQTTYDSTTAQNGQSGTKGEGSPRPACEGETPVEHAPQVPPPDVPKSNPAAVESHGAPAPQSLPRPAGGNLNVVSSATGQVVGQLAPVDAPPAPPILPFSEDAFVNRLAELGCAADNAMLRTIRTGMKCQEAFFLERLSTKIAALPRGSKFAMANMPRFVRETNEAWANGGQKAWQKGAASGSAPKPKCPECGVKLLGTPFNGLCFDCDARRAG